METIRMSFQLSKKHIFEVSYESTGNDVPRFSTSGGVFNQPKTDWDRCGQCQDEFKNFRTAYDFYKRWDYLHLKYLTEEQYALITADIEILKTKYNWIDSQKFYKVREFSKQRVKK